MAERSGWKLAGAIALLAAIAVAATLWQREELPPDEFAATAALDAPLDVGAGERPDAGRARWLLLTERPGRRHFWGFANGMRWGKPASEPFRQIDLWAFDARLDLVWQRRLRDDDQAFHRENYRLASVPGDEATVAVMFDPPIAVRLADGAPAAAVPEAGHGTWAAHDTGGLQVRGAVHAGEWIGVLTDAEAAKLASAEGRAQGWHPTAFGPPAEAGATYGVWTARADPARPGFIDERTLRRIDGGAGFPQAGLLPDADGVPIGLARSRVFVLSRGERGILSLSAIDTRQGDVAWRSPLSQRELLLAAAVDDGLLLYGHAAPAGTASWNDRAHVVLTHVRGDDGTRRDRAVGDLVGR